MVAAQYLDAFDVPLYNVWTFSALSNEVGHFGTTEQRILDRLLYLYTDPFDAVLDPFAGGGLQQSSRNRLGIGQIDQSLPINPKLAGHGANQFTGGVDNHNSNKVGGG